MARRDFNSWISTMKSSIATWTYYTDFEKVYRNVKKCKVELNILNSLIGSMNIEEDFRNLVNEYPKVISAVPILLAKRESEIEINDASGRFVFDFTNMNYSLEQYILFMRNTGLFDLIQNHIINNLVDYVMGVEVGLDSNARKNRTGDAMEDLVESYLIKSGLVKNKTYFKEMGISEIERKYGLDLSTISNEGKSEKRFDFVFVNKSGVVFGCECNFYGGQGSKLNSTAGRYKLLTLESRDINGFKFVWFTDGVGWNSAKRHLEETFDVLDDLYNLNDLDNNILDILLDYPN